MPMHDLQLQQCRQLPNCEHRRLLARLEEGWVEYDRELELTRHDANRDRTILGRIRNEIDNIAAAQAAVLMRCDFEGSIGPGNPDAPDVGGPVL